MKKIMLILAVFVGILVLSGFAVAAVTNKVPMDNHPPYTPSNPYPMGEFPVDINVNLSWDGGDPDPGDTVTYYVYLDWPSGPPAVIGPYPANQTRIEYDPGELDFCKMYFWQVTAVDNHDSPTQGPVWSFVTTCPNFPPSVPTIQGPQGGTVGRRYEYKLVAEDPEGDNVSYFIDWGDGTSEGWTDYQSSGKPISLGHVWNTPDYFQIRCKAKDIYGAEGNWSEVEILITKNKASSFNIDITNQNTLDNHPPDLETNKENDPQPDIDFIFEFYGPDTYVSHQYPEENYGDSKVIRISNEYGVGGSPGWANVAYIQFPDLINLGGFAKIVSAKLNFYYHDYENTDPEGRDLNVYRVNESWSWTRLTWDSQPAYNPEPITSAKVPSSTGKWIIWDVTSDIKKFVNEEPPPYCHQGYRISDDSYWGESDIPTTMFQSVDSDKESLRPYLLIISRVSTSQQSQQFLLRQESLHN